VNNGEKWNVKAQRSVELASGSQVCATNEGQKQENSGTLQAKAADHMCSIQTSHVW